MIVSAACALPHNAPMQGHPSNHASLQPGTRNSLRLTEEFPGCDIRRACGGRACLAVRREHRAWCPALLHLVLCPVLCLVALCRLPLRVRVVPCR